MKDKESKYKEYDCVQVLQGVTDPDFDTNLGGWSGIIEEIDLSDNGLWLYGIRWDRKTLSKIGEEYIDKCEDNNLDYEYIYLEEQELELINENKDPEKAFLLA